MQVAAMIVDTGGEEGTTEKAYAYYRRVREQGLQKRVKLYKGGSDKKAPILRESLVGKIGRKGKDDIPLLVCNTNLLSDAVDARTLARASSANSASLKPWPRAISY